MARTVTFDTMGHIIMGSLQIDGATAVHVDVNGPESDLNHSNHLIDTDVVLGEDGL